MYGRVVDGIAKSSTTKRSSRQTRGKNGERPAESLLPSGIKLWIRYGSA